MAAYFCATCNLFDDAGDEKRVFHCDGCGICRVGGRENFFHCATCCGCYPLSLRDKHKCLEGSMHRECAICLEVTFASLERVHVLPCGHVLHGACWKEYINHGCVAGCCYGWMWWQKLTCAAMRVIRSHYRCPSCRTRMFWVDDGDDGDDGEEGDDGEDDGDEEDEDESGDETGDGDSSESEDGEEEGEESEDEDSDAASSASGSAEVASSAQATPVSSPGATTESGVAQRLVNAIFNAISSAAESDESDESDESAAHPHAS